MTKAITRQTKIIMLLALIAAFAVGASALSVYADHEETDARGAVQTETRNDREPSLTPTLFRGSDENKEVSGDRKNRDTEGSEVRFRDSVKSRLESRRTDVEVFRANMHDEIQNRIESKKVELEQKREERIRALSDRQKERVEKLLTRMFDRLDAAVERLEKITDRVESRIVKLEEAFADRGIDLSEARLQLEEARTAINEAGAGVQAAREAAENALGSTGDTKAAYLVARDFIKTGKESIKLAHTALVEAIREVKVAIGGERSAQNGNTATSTDDGNNQDEDTPISTATST